MPRRCFAVLCEACASLRRFKLPSGRAAVVLDSVGFLADLPHALFAAFEATLQELAAAYMPPGAASDAVCALAAGGATVAVINPVDVVRTRLYSQPLDSSGAGTLYRGATDCVGKILAVEGPLAFYKVRAPPPA